RILASPKPGRRPRKRELKMPLTDAAALAIAKLLMGDIQTIFNAANAKIGVGDSTTAFAKTQTDLQAATNKFTKPVLDSGYPIRTGASISYRATFATSEANYTWQEWGVFNASPTGGEMLNRKVETLGATHSAQTLQCTV